MVWVRYDDEFHHHDKVMSARDTDPGSLALHLLGNTWTASSKTPGWVPAYVPRQLVGPKGKKWAQVLADARLWDIGELDGKPGWWVHDFDTYNPVDEATKRRRSESARKAANARWHPEEDAATHAPGMPDACDPHAEDMPSDAIARGHPVPVPVPSGGSSEGGDRPVTLRQVGASKPPTCSQHPNGNYDGPCAGCKRVREYEQRMDAEVARERVAAAANCPDCHGTNWLESEDGKPVRKCDHRRAS